MKMQFHHSGRQFFFVTLALENRTPILSRLVGERPRPALLPHGETVKTLLASMHAAFPCVTVSDFVIMPEHVHFLLIVDYAANPSFSPLWGAHRLMDAAEKAWSLFPSGGDATVPPLSRDQAVALLADVAERARLDRGHLTLAETAAQGCCGCPHPRWERHAWVDLSFDSRQLAAIRRYIEMNPARYFWKLDNPDMFRFRANLRHPALDPAFPWSAVGDITLLASPFLFLVRLTMKKTAAELEDEIAAHLERARQGWTPVCGFLSPGEREFERRLKALPHSRWIKTVPYGLPERYDPSVEDSRWLAEHRQLVLSSFDRTDIPPFQITRPGCLAMNERIARMVATNDDPPAPSSGGSGAASPRRS
jgi:hypothetical protein